MSSTERSTRLAALRFGAGAGAVGTLIGVWLWLRKHHPHAGVGVASGGAFLLVLALISPPAVLAVRVAWMRFAAALGWVNSRVLLTIVFFLLVTPFGWLKRRFGRDTLALAWNPAHRGTTWREKTTPYDAKHWERPF
jgi:Saxitoxin biosynthesis operon protein SxtJ